MRWDRNHRSDYVEDRRGMRTGGGGAGLAFILFWIFRRFGIPGVVVAVVAYGAFSYFSGGGTGQRVGAQDGPGSGPGASNDEMKAFVSFVLDDAQATWDAELKRNQRHYQPAVLVLFTDRVDSACGRGSAAVGPFYCPGDKRVFIDLSFYDALRDRLGAPGDFAQAYVIAHEVGHHVQNLTGSLERGSEEGAGKGSVRTELQADCYAGVWAHAANKRGVLEPGDIGEALRAAESIGDDSLQRQSTGTVRPESWTHGSSDQRMRWFRRGLEAGTMDACDTFAPGVSL